MLRHRVELSVQFSVYSLEYSNFQHSTRSSPCKLRVQYPVLAFGLSIISVIHKEKRFISATLTAAVRPGSVK